MKHLLALALILSLATAACAEDWPRFRGPTGQGLSAETGLATEWSPTSAIAWKTPIPGSGWSSPILSGDRLYVTAAAEKGASLHLLCLDRKTGAVQWDKEVLKQETGNKREENSFATPTPVTDGQRVYVLAFDGSFVAVTMDGEPVWAWREFKFYSQHGLAVSPILYKDLVIAPFDWSSRGPDKYVGWQIPWEEAFVVAIDKNTGKTAWKTKRGPSRIGHVTPLVVSVNGEDQLVSTAGDVCQGFNPTTGELLWTCAGKGETPIPALVAGDGLVFTTPGFGGPPALRAVRLGGKGDITKTHIAWEDPKDVPMVASMIYVKPYLFALADSGVIRCLKAETGEVVWRDRLTGKFWPSPIWAEGRLYCTSDKGETTILEAGPAFKVVGKGTLDEKTMASPAVSQKQIFIRTEKTLWCIGGK